MKKLDKYGFVLAETLIVTTVVAGFLVYIFVQLSNLGSSYNTSLKNNTVEGLYALNDIRYIINKNDTFKEYITTLSNSGIDDISNITCTNFTGFTKSFCDKFNELIAYENIDSLYISYNNPIMIDFTSFTDNDIKNLILNAKVNELLDYRLSAKFNNGTYATIGW